jgi:hypothetical protein
MRDPHFKMPLKDLFMIMEKLKYLYWNLQLYGEISVIMDL